MNQILLEEQSLGRAGFGNSQKRSTQLLSPTQRILGNLISDPQRAQENTFSQEGGNKISPVFANKMAWTKALFHLTLSLMIPCYYGNLCFLFNEVWPDEKCCHGYYQCLKLLTPAALVRKQGCVSSFQLRMKSQSRQKKSLWIKENCYPWVCLVHHSRRERGKGQRESRSR